MALAPGIAWLIFQTCINVLSLASKPAPPFL
jgi:hypothetical protein